MKRSRLAINMMTKKRFTLFSNPWANAVTVILSLSTIDLSEAYNKFQFEEKLGRGVSTSGEDTHTLRLKSELFDLRVGYANPILRLGESQRGVRINSYRSQRNKKTTELFRLGCPFIWRRKRGMLLGVRIVLIVPLQYKFKPASPRDADTANTLCLKVA